MGQLHMRRRKEKQLKVKLIQHIAQSILMSLSQAGLREDERGKSSRLGWLEIFHSLLEAGLEY